MTVTAPRRVTTGQLLIELADDIRHLTEPYTHTEQYIGWTKTRNRTVLNHTTDHPPLLHQLRLAAALATRPHIGTIGRHTPDATVPAAVEILHDIRNTTTRWLRHLHGQPSDNLTTDLRALVGVAPALDPDTLTRLAVDIARLRRSAANYGGW